MHESNHDHADNHAISASVENPTAQATENEVAHYKILTFADRIPEQYEGFVYSSWMHSLRYGNDIFRLMDSRPYYEAYKNYITSILKRPGTRLKIAVLDDDEDVALGWCVIEGPVIHYVYVPKDYRNIGIATSLVPKDLTDFTHITTIGLSIWNKKIPNVRFNPFL